MDSKGETARQPWHPNHGLAKLNLPLAKESPGGSAVGHGATASDQTHGLDRYSRVLATVSSLLSRWFFLVVGFTNSARLTCGEITSSARLTSGTGGD